VIQNLPTDLQPTFLPFCAFPMANTYRSASPVADDTLYLNVYSLTFYTSLKTLMHEMCLHPVKWLNRSTFCLWWRLVMLKPDFLHNRPPFCQLIFTGYLNGIITEMYYC